MPAPVRMLVTDLDGTLLDPHGRLTPRTRRAVREAQQQGVIVALATARRLGGTLPLARELGGPLHLVVYDGALVQSYPQSQTLLRRTLPKAQAQRAAEIMAEAHLQPIAQHTDTSGERLLVAPNGGRNTWAAEYLSHNRDQAAYVPLERLITAQPAPVRLVAFGPLRRIRAAAKAVALELALGEAIRSEAAVGTQVLPLGSYGAAELTVFAAGVSKGSAMHHLAADLGISLTHVVAIGDGVNDVSMLRLAGTSIAMEGSPPAVLRAAAYRTPSNAEDGAACAIERFVLNEETVLEDAGA